MTAMKPEVLDAANAALDRSAKLRRKRLLLGLGAAVLTVGTGCYFYEHLYASKFVSTDNAYTAAETAQVTPAIGGIVREVRVTDTQQVKRGQIVVVLDDTDALLAVDSRAHRQDWLGAAGGLRRCASIDARSGQGA